MFPRPVATREVGQVFRAASGASGRLLALAMDTLDGEIALYDALRLEPQGTLLLGAMRTVGACALTPDDALLIVATHDNVSAFDLSTTRSRWTAPMLAGDEPALTLSPNGERLAVGRAGGGFVILRTTDGTHVATVDGESAPRALAWDVEGVIAVDAKRVTLFNARGAPRLAVEDQTTAWEAGAVALLDDLRFVVMGTTPQYVWLHLRSRRDAALAVELRIEGDLRAEGLAFAGGVIFVATEGGVYRADPPFEQLTRWLPPLGGAHDPTRIVAVAGDHLAVCARDLRLFRTRS